MKDLSILRKFIEAEIRSKQGQMTRLPERSPGWEAMAAVEDELKFILDTYLK